MLLLLLTGCCVLDPQGLIGAAKLKIMYNALAIMLAIVLPTIVATYNMLPMHQMMQMQR
jgi:cytochrome o ubiquinol oxidase subunit II